jgi:hypothetical protein
MEQPSLFPDQIPDCAIRFWNAVDRYYATGTHKPPTRDALVKKFDPPQPSVRSLDRWRGQHPGMMGAWPPKRGQRRPWEPPVNGLARPDAGEIRSLRRVRVPGFDDSGKIVTMVQYFDQETGELVRSRIARDDENDFVAH